LTREAAGSLLAAGALLALVAGCSGGGSGAAPGVDAAVEASIEAGPDATADAPAGASADGGSDADGRAESQVDAGADADAASEVDAAIYTGPIQTHSASLVTNPAGTTLYVVHPDADSVTLLDVASRQILHDVLLAAVSPSPDDAGRYAPAVSPRALALDSTGSTLYVTGQRSGRLYVLDASTGAIQGDVFVCSEPVGVLVAPGDASVYVACAQDDEIVEVRASDRTVVKAVSCPRKPWALAWTQDRRTLLATHFLGPGVSAFGTSPLALAQTWALADGPPQNTPGTAGPEDPTEPHGQVRGLYDAVVRPGTSELWVAHVMLGTDTPQPDLDFRETVFPALTLLDDQGNQQARLSVQANPGDGESFGDVVSGPHAIAFSPDGALAFVVNADSEDVLVVDAERRVEAQLVRPLPGHLPEGVVWAGGDVFVQERGSEDIAAFRVTRGDAGLSIAADGDAFPSLTVDPMPATLRLGQELYFSANSDRYPLTQDHWVACASCHLEGRSDAVTWRFAQGPRDTPTNAGGLLDTGFLFRTADRTQVQDYWRTIDVEQGGHFDISAPTQEPLLDALAQFVNFAIPTPIPPSTDAAHTLTGSALADLRSQGATVFTQLGCASCHSGPAKTDSGGGNPALDLTGPVVSTPTSGGVLLHDVGTCVTSGDWTDVAHDDILGDARDGCSFDTPALRGVWDSTPYLHDGSAATLDDVLPSMLQAVAAPGQAPPVLSPADEKALVEYLRSL
jgi:DNA-binding beta-propeller fold protein YncE